MREPVPAAYYQELLTPSIANTHWHERDHTLGVASMVRADEHRRIHTDHIKYSVIATLEVISR